MNINNSKLIAALSIGMFVGALATIGVSASNAVSSGISACVNKKTLVIELARNSKCKSGYSKITFGSPTAGTSPVSAPVVSPSPIPSPSSTTIYNNLSVYDAAGTKLGPLTFANSYSQWAFIKNGIVISAGPETGTISDNGTAGYFANSNCTGNIYWPLDINEIRSRFVASDPLFLNHVPAGTSARTGVVKFMVQDSTIPRLPASTSEMWKLSDDGACHRSTEYAPNGPSWSGTLLWVGMKEIGRAQDFSGPLTIR